ncbi:MAG: hypothetical protein ABR573_03090 [Candidatus Dormibacteria bacterium]
MTMLTQLSAVGATAPQLLAGLRRALWIMLLFNFAFSTRVGVLVFAVAAWVPQRFANRPRLRGPYRLQGAVAMIQGVGSGVLWLAQFGSPSPLTRLAFDATALGLFLIAAALSAAMLVGMIRAQKETTLSTA